MSTAISALLAVSLALLAFLPFQAFADVPVQFWIKEKVKWWAQGKLPPSEFDQVLHRLSDEHGFELQISNTQQVPFWFKTVSVWWASDYISDREFMDATSYLAGNGLLKASSGYQYNDKLYTEREFSGHSPLFRIFAYDKDFVLDNGERVPRDMQFEIRPELAKEYELVRSDGDTAVILPIFTSTAYYEPGFYTYYRGECDSKCLTKKIAYGRSYGYSGSSNAFKVLQLLGYKTISDIEIDKNPDILSSYNKIIVLHNEYVTKKEFDAITAHQNVIYLYPNALYAEIQFDHQDDTITLIRGHNYPSEEIRNGFDWDLDNSEMEYDNTCADWKFIEVENGKMLSCYPENIIFSDIDLLKAIKNG